MREMKGQGEIMYSKSFSIAVSSRSRHFLIPFRIHVKIFSLTISP